MLLLVISYLLFGGNGVCASLPRGGRDWDFSWENGIDYALSDKSLLEDFQDYSPDNLQDGSKQGPLWAADVVDGPVVVRRATPAEARWFDAQIEPLIQRAQQQSPGGGGSAAHRRGAARVAPQWRPPADTSRQLYQRLVVHANKFIEVAGADRGQSLSEEHHLDPTITVFTRDGYTAVLITSGARDWQMFLRPPSPLPAPPSPPAGGHSAVLSEQDKVYLYSKLLRYFTVSLRFDL